MATKNEIASFEAKQDEKMIEIKLRFWTNDISPEKGKVIPKHAWAAGVINMESNRSHDIAPSNPQPFHSLLDVGAIIERVLIDQGVVLHSSRRMRKYIAENKKR